MVKSKLENEAIERIEKSGAEEQKKYIEDVHKFENTFGSIYKKSELDTMFETEYAEMETNRADTLLKMTKGEIENQKKLKILKNKSYFNLTRLEFKQCFSKSIKYITDHIFKIDATSCYVLCKNASGQIIPMEYTDAKFKALHQGFPQALRYYYDHDLDKSYVITSAISKPRVYTDNEIDYLNTFQGFKYQFDKTCEEEHKKRRDDLDFYWDHIKNILCNKNESVFKLNQAIICEIMKGQHTGVCIVYNGARGAGKSTPAQGLMNSIGVDISMMATDENTLFGTFNGHMINKVFCLIDDPYLEYSKQTFGVRLKPKITEPRISYRDLFKKAETLPNLTNYIYTCNVEDAGSLNESCMKDEHPRYLVCDISKEKKDNAYYERLRKLCIDKYNDESFWKALYYECITLNHGVNIQEELKKLKPTETKKKSIRANLQQHNKFLINAYEEEHDYLDNVSKPNDLYNEYLKWYEKEYKYDKGIKPQKKNNLLDNIKNYDFISIKPRKINGIVCSNSIKIDKEKLESRFLEWDWIDKKEGYDEVEEIIQGDEYDNGVNKTEKAIPMVLMPEFEKLRKENEELKKKLAQYEVKGEINLPDPSSLNHICSLIKKLTAKRINKGINFFNDTYTHYLLGEERTLEDGENMLEDDEIDFVNIKSKQKSYFTADPKNLFDFY